MERHYNIGGSGFPLRGCQMGILELSIAGEHLQARCDNNVFWLASDPHGEGVWTVRLPVRVSLQYGVEIALASADLTGAYALAYSHDGHLCVGFVLPPKNRHGSMTPARTNGTGAEALVRRGMRLRRHTAMDRLGCWRRTAGGARSAGE